MTSLEGVVSDMHLLVPLGESGAAYSMNASSKQGQKKWAAKVRVQEELPQEDVGLIKVFGNELFLTALEVALLQLPNSYNAQSALLELIHFSIHHSWVFFFPPN